MRGMASPHKQRDPTTSVAVGWRWCYLPRMATRVGWEGLKLGGDRSGLCGVDTATTTRKGGRAPTTRLPVAHTSTGMRAHA